MRIGHAGAVRYRLKWVANNQWGTLLRDHVGLPAPSFFFCHPVRVGYKRGWARTLTSFFLSLSLSLSLVFSLSFSHRCGVDQLDRGRELEGAWPRHRRRRRRRRQKKIDRSHDPIPWPSAFPLQILVMDRSPTKKKKQQKTKQKRATSQIRPAKHQKKSINKENNQSSLSHLVVPSFGVECLELLWIVVSKIFIG